MQITNRPTGQRLLQLVTRSRPSAATWRGTSSWPRRRWFRSGCWRTRGSLRSPSGSSTGSGEEFAEPGFRTTSKGPSWTEWTPLCSGCKRQIRVRKTTSAKIGKHNCPANCLRSLHLEDKNGRKNKTSSLKLTLLHPWFVFGQGLSRRSRQRWPDRPLRSSGTWRRTRFGGTRPWTPSHPTRSRASPPSAAEICAETFAGATTKVLTKKVLTRKVPLLEDTKTPRYIRPNLTI